VRDSVTVHMVAPPDRIWELVSDVTRIGRYSPWALLGWVRGRTNGNGMRTTLERIKAEVEAVPGPDGG
jgi:hypothetical protein